LEYTKEFIALPANGIKQRTREGQEMSENQPIAAKPSLYDRLGGVYSISTVVDDFVNRIMVDPRLNANPFVDEAHHRVPPAGFKYLVTEMLCGAAAGRRSIRAATWPLRISTSR
jgi:hypothetical protein